MRKPSWPLSRRRKRERFARAVERGHDTEFGNELAVISALRRLGTAGPVHPLDDDQRARIARQATNAPAARMRRAPRRRFAVSLSGALAFVLIFFGAGLLAAERALPGDALYELKRLRESVALGLTFDDEAKALQHLTYAEDRLDELATLAERGETHHSGFTIGLTDFTADTTAGVARLTKVTVSSDGNLLGPLRSWANRQADRLEALRPSAPAALTVPRELLRRVDLRAQALAARMPCYRITSGQRDDLGMVPATGRCSTPEQDDGWQAAKPNHGTSVGGRSSSENPDPVAEPEYTTFRPTPPPAVPTPPLPPSTMTVPSVVLPEPPLPSARLPVPPSPPPSPEPRPTLPRFPGIPGLPGLPGLPFSNGTG